MMTHLTCPQCSTRIPASNINVQEKIAVCPACDTVFRFDTPAATPAKAKHRKVKQPANLTLRDDDEKLDMAFRTNFRLGQNEDFIVAMMAFVVFAFLTFIFTFPSDRLVATGLFLFPLGGMLLAIYRLGLLLFNQTHITADNTLIKTARTPLPNPFAQEYEVPLADVVSIRCEETDASKQAKYDTPRYRVFAEMANGSEKLIVNDVVEDYGFFIAARLQEHIAAQNEHAGKNLLDDELQNLPNERIEAVSDSQTREYRLRESEHRLSSSAISKR
jgi:hypothetical protein